MRNGALIVAFGLAFALGCGGGDDGSPAPPPQDGGETGGGGDTDGGGGTAGGGGDASGGGGGTAGGGTGGGEGGGGATPGGGTRVASSDGTVVLERLDESAECDALVPTRAPDAVKVALVPPPQPGRGIICGEGISEGTGHVAVLVGARFPDGTLWRFFTPDGRAEGNIVVHSRHLFPQPDGWQAARLDSASAPGAVEHLTLSAGGAVRQRSVHPADGDLGTWDLYEDPLGGTALVFTSRPTTPVGAPCVGKVLRFDAAGAWNEARATPRSCSHFAAAVPGGGETLVLEEARPGEVGVRWYARDGAAVQSSVDAPVQAGRGVGLAPLLDGSTVMAEGGEWTRRYAHLAAQGGPPPAWLAERPSWRFRNTRGARGYALFPPSGSLPTTGNCSQIVELRAPSGRLCAKATFLEPSVGGCSAGPIDQGWDGTVVQRSAREHCTWRWWPRLLAGE